MQVNMETEHTHYKRNCLRIYSFTLQRGHGKPYPSCSLTDVCMAAKVLIIYERMKHIQYLVTYINTLHLVT